MVAGQTEQLTQEAVRPHEITRRIIDAPVVVKEAAHQAHPAVTGRFPPPLATQEGNRQPPAAKAQAPTPTTTPGVPTAAVPNSPG
ncbi:hypothetical protein [Streptomyces sp. NPDC090080]|uniref:hypothetical protein n=1 Tax=Streptomyces sp. NPDC090080 TaxID=3365939 RepID=UPI00382EC671